jgi:hypothetical protein
MSLRRYRGLLVIVLWQAPNPVAVDSTGRIQGILGFGGGQYENVRTSCEGDVLGASPVKFQGAGAQVDAWPTRSVRTSWFAGAISSDSAEWDGAYYGGLVALELQHFGIGLGAVGTPSEDDWPAAYLRAGNRDEVHFRFELAPPNPPLGAAGVARLGVGYHLGHLRGLGVYGGTAFCHARCDGGSKTGLFGELQYPIGSRFDLGVRALAGPGEEFANVGVSVTGRLHFGRAP